MKGKKKKRGGKEIKAPSLFTYYKLKACISLTLKATLSNKSTVVYY